MASGDGRVRVSLTVGSPTDPGVVPRAPGPGRLPTTGTVLAAQLLALALLMLCIGLVLMRFGRVRRERRASADATGGVARIPSFER